MKLYYNLTAQCLYLISLCLFITSTISQQSQLNFFNYTENTTNTEFPQNAPKVVNIRTYDDGTTLVHIIRYGIQTADCSRINGINLEPILRIRVIQLNGTVIEINANLDIDSLNFCLFKNEFLVNPIEIFPLQQPFILVNYYKTNNTSDLKTYEEWGQVIDWSGKSLSVIYYGPSYVNPQGSWVSESKIRLNVNEKLGFLRYVVVNNDTSKWIEWQQYLVDDFGNLSRLSSDNVLINLEETSLVTTSLSTIDSGYAIFQAYTSQIEYNATISFTRVELNVIFISYNQTISNEHAFILYQGFHRVINISNLETQCVTVPFGIGHVCTVFVNGSTISYYVEINFLSSGAVLSSTLIPPPKLTGLPQQDFKRVQMPFGGYIFDTTFYNFNSNTNYHYIGVYNEDKLFERLGPFITNEFDVYAIMNNNNTFMLASSYTNSQNTSWSLLTISLPQFLKDHDNGYKNLLIDKITPPINASVNSLTNALRITFFDPVVLSTGNLTIYKTSDNSIRQRVSASMEEFCTIDPDGKTIIIKVISSTFNEYGELYSVTMDNNFVKSKEYNEPLKGFVGGNLKYNSSNILALSDFYFIDILIDILYYLVYRAPPSEDRNVYSAHLTTEATKTVLTLSRNDQTIYFNSLLDEISIKLPVRRERLNIYGYPRPIHDSITDLENIEFYILIVNSPNPAQNENTVLGVVSNLDTMITDKAVTEFSIGLTNDLDSTFGLKPSGIMLSAWNEYFVQVIVAIIIYIIFCLLSHILNYKLKSKEFEAISSAILRLGLIIPNFFFSTVFVMTYSNVVPELYFPSLLLLNISALSNFYIATYTIYKGFKDPVIGKSFQQWVIKHRSLTAMFIILTATDYEYLFILRDVPRFTKGPYRYEQINIFNMLKRIFGIAIMWGAFFDVFFRNIPQIIIQKSNLEIKESYQEIDEKSDLKFIEADSINKKASLRSLSMLQIKYCSTLIDVQEITESLKGTN
ncbi:3296_t:CDS:10 [Cetraspora pellucida]|uniref:3296_t:CDS:1 n=2 Tax=Gigasporaceae TaxID=36753 RepID=A0A9N9AW70_9GLOM|nr:3296_t:CDS:10 [Cetraspora pellucida]